MAKRKTQAAPPAKKGANKIQKANNPLMAAAFEAGVVGNENVTRDCISVPFLRIAQKLTPQIDPDNPAHIDGLKPGDFYSTVSQESFGNALRIVILYFDQQYTIWGKNRGSFKGTISVKEKEKLARNGEIQEEGVKTFDAENDYVDTRNFYCFLPDHPGQGILIFPLTSTGIRHSKNIISMLEGVKEVHPHTGRLVTAPYCMSVLELKTAKNTKDDNVWWQVGTKTTLVRHLGKIGEDKPGLKGIDPEALTERIIEELTAVKVLAEKSKTFDYSDMESKTIYSDDDYSDIQEM